VLTAVLCVVLPLVAATLVWPGPALSATLATRPRTPGPEEGDGRRADVGRLGEAPRRRAGAGRGHRRREAARDEALAELLGLVAAPLRAGVPPAAALAAVEPSVRAGPLGPLVGDLVAASRTGDPLAPVWGGWADRLASSALAFVGRAWSLSEDAGAPLVDALTAAADGVRARRRARERLATAASGPKASMAVLSLLPVAGPLVGLACGISPVELYLARPLASLSLVVGLSLAALATWWSRRILGGAS